MKKVVCNHSTNGKGCRELINPATGLFEQCAFSGFCPNYNGNSKEEREEFLVKMIMNLGVRMLECQRRLEKGGRNHNDEKQLEIKNIKKQIQKEINRINCKIKSLKIKPLKLKQAVT